MGRRVYADQRWSAEEDFVVARPMQAEGARVIRRGRRASVDVAKLICFQVDFDETARSPSQ
jgi:hypothetical protein